jgi:3-oxoacyl-[acyl-carrier-protein] synthase-3
MISMPAGGSRKPASPETVRAHEHTIRIQGVPLFRVAVKRLAEAVADTLKEFGVGVSDLGRVVFHQANGRLLSAVLERLRIPPDKMYSVLERFGNASSASLPIALDHAVREGRVAPGELVLLGTFGGGLTWGTALVRW